MSFKFLKLALQYLSRRIQALLDLSSYYLDENTKFIPKYVYLILC